MIGNDIVDLLQARKESNWRRKGFLDKVFTIHEQHLIRTATDPDCMVWLLWSMKESAYKVAVRNGGKRRFAPTKLACDLTRLDDKNAVGIVHYEEKEYLTKSSLTARYIATVSTNKKVLPNVKHCRTGVPPVQARCPEHASLYNNPSGRPGGEPRPAFFICLYLTLSVHHSWFDNIIVPLDEMAYPQQHTILWEKIKQYYATALSVPEAEIHFHKDEGGAPWMTLPSAEKVPLSVAHHGRFGAFVIGGQSSVCYLQLVHSLTADCRLKDCGLKTITPYLAQQCPALPAIADHLPKLPGLLF